MNKAIITCALTGGLSTPGDPGTPLTPDEIVAEAANAVSAGAAIVRLHPRDDHGDPIAEVTVLRRTMRTLKERADCLIEVSTVISPNASDEERLEALAVKPDVAAIVCGSINVGDDVLVQSNPTLRKLIEAAQQNGIAKNLVCFGHSQIWNARRLIDEGILQAPYHFTLILGAAGGAPGDVRTLLHMVDALPRGATWFAAGVGRSARVVIPATLPMGGHVRVGFEDNRLLRSDQKAENSAQMVSLAVTLAQGIGRDVATATEARTLLAT